ncbi:MAG: PucR family transcriptional regulator ligand-binding domain-containing protein [Spirochaetales bacterium]|nr:PucR family transcriptional regulator ligand-binding domain-containing protein [Spirochaetales bacterium]
MSITVEDALKLPTMKNARLLAGKNGLKNNIYGITVFDYIGSEDLQEEFYAQNIRNLTSQMVLTSFSAIPDDAQKQCDNLRRMSQCGQVALVLYYVGIIMKNVDPMLIQTAESLNMPLIAMPSNRMNLRYGDLISEVSEAIVSDRMHYNGSLMTEIIGQVSKMPSDKQTIDSVLSLLSSKLHVSAVLTDVSLNILGEAIWPEGNQRIYELLTEENVSHHVKKRKAFAPVPGSYLWFVPIHDRGPEPMRLFLIEEGSALTDIMLDMARETVQLAVELWSNRHSAVITSELVKAILNDEPIRMRRLSDVLHIDIKSIHNTWFIRCTDKDTPFTADMIQAIRNIMGALDSEILLEPYRTPLGETNDLVMFFRNPMDTRLLESCAQSILDTLKSMGQKDVRLTMLDYKFTTSDVRRAFSIWNQSEATARTVFPLLEIFHESEIELARQCNEIIRLGEASITSATGCLDALVEHHNSEEMLKTLEVYFLDADLSMQKTSEILGVHKNTIKYRINMVCDALGQQVGNPVTSARLTTALAIRRLMNRSWNQ